MINHWFLAVISIGAGLLIGEIGGRMLRSTLSRPSRSPEVREMARPLSTFLFWAATAVGVVVSLLAASPDSLKELPHDTFGRLPQVLMAFVLVLAGYAVGVGLAAAVGQSALRASGVRHRGLERLLRIVVMTAFVVAALSQMGVNTTILVVVLAAATGAPALAMALLTAHGGRDVASNIAAGRAVRGRLKIGDHLAVGSATGIITSINATSVELGADDGTTTHVPLQVLMQHQYTVSDSVVRSAWNR